MFTDRASTKDVELVEFAIKNMALVSIVANGATETDNEVEPDSEPKM